MTAINNNVFSNIDVYYANLKCSELNSNFGMFLVTFFLELFIWTSAFCSITTKYDIQGIPQIL